MHLHRKLQDMAIFIEFVIGSGLAIFFHTVLEHEQAAYLVFAFGIMLSLCTFLIREQIEKAKSTLLEEYRQIHEVPGALARVSDPECQAKAHEAIASTLKTLHLLQQGYVQLDEMSFYLEGAVLADRAVSHINCVDILNTGWLSRASLLNFYQSNLRAIERGVRITRVFIAGREELSDPELQKVIVAQHRDRIDVRLAFREELPAALDISGRDTNSSLDFAIYDSCAVTDAFPQPGKYHGRKTSQPNEIRKYLHLYNLIEHSAQAVTIADGRLILPSEVVPLAGAGQYKQSL